MMTTEKTAVISVGRIYCDLIFTGLNELPVLGRELFARDMEIAAGGGAFIAAAHFAHIGRPVALLARLGTDTFSRDIGEKMARSGVDLQFLEHSADAGPQVTVATVVGQDRAFLTRRAGAACITGNQDVIRKSLGDAGRDRAHTHLRNQLYAHAGGGIAVLQVVNQLLEILDRVNVMVGRRTNESHAGSRIANPRNVLIDLATRQLTPFTRLRPL